LSQDGTSQAPISPEEALMTNPNEFFTLQALATFGGITFAVTVITNTLRSLTNRDPKFVAFIVSLALCFAIAWSTLKQPLDYLIAFLNGCLIYCTSMGLNNQVNITTTTPTKPETRGRKPSHLLKRINEFFKPW
jgi:hypothetical protein